MFGEWLDREAMVVPAQVSEPRQLTTRPSFTLMRVEMLRKTVYDRLATRASRGDLEAARQLAFVTACVRDRA